MNQKTQINEGPTSIAASLFRVVVLWTAALLCFFLGTRAYASEPKTDDIGWDESFLSARRDALLDEFNAFEREHEFGCAFKVKTSERFIFVYDTSDAYIEWLRALTAEVAKAFDKFCDRLELETERPDEPLTVVVFATREEFDAYAATIRGLEYLEQKNKPIGFYNHGDNRSVLFDMTATEALRVAADLGGGNKNGSDFSRRRINAEAKSIKTRGNAGSNTSTIVHEISHQLAFNHGVFDLWLRQPDWIVEGMATTFEPTNADAPLGWRFRNVFPVNEGRLRDFVKAANYDEKLSILDEIVQSDRFETELSVEGYAASWALFYYCYRKKPKELKAYIELLKKRDRRHEYSERERMEEFEKCFGDAGEFGKKFVRFMRDLNSR